MAWVGVIAAAFVFYWLGKLRALKQLDKAYKEGRVCVVEKITS